VGNGVEIPFPTLVEVVTEGIVLVGVEVIGTTTGLDVVVVTSVEDTAAADENREEEIGFRLGAGAGSLRASTQ
jgi:hypothetical protein